MRTPATDRDKARDKPREYAVRAALTACCRLAATPRSSHGIAGPAAGSVARRGVRPPGGGAAVLPAGRSRLRLSPVATLTADRSGVRAGAGGAPRLYVRDPRAADSPRAGDGRAALRRAGARHPRPRLRAPRAGRRPALGPRRRRRLQPRPRALGSGGGDRRSAGGPLCAGGVLHSPAAQDGAGTVLRIGSPGAAAAAIPPWPVAGTGTGRRSGPRGGRAAGGRSSACG